MRKGSSFSRNPSNRIDEEAEQYEETSSGSDYESQLIPAPVAAPKAPTGPKASSNLFDAELASDDEEEDGHGLVAADEEEDFGGEEADLDKDEMIRDRIAQSQKQMKHLLELLSEDQLRRYDTFRRIGFPRSGIRKVPGLVCPAAVPSHVLVGHQDPGPAR